MKSILSFFQSSENNTLFPAISILAVLIIGLILGALLEKLRSHSRLRTERKDAVKKSKAVLRGQIYEQLAPYFPNFPVNPKSLQFLGKPIDYVAFVSADEPGETIKEIVFIEIKTGNSVMTASEKSIKKAVEEKRVRFIEYRM